MDECQPCGVGVLLFVRILGWNKARAWVDWYDWHRTTLEGRLGKLTTLNRVAIRRLGRQVRDRECIEVSLERAADRFDAESIRSFLESVGAEAVLEDT